MILTECMHGGWLGGCTHLIGKLFQERGGGVHGIAVAERAHGDHDGGRRQAGGPKAQVALVCTAIPLYQRSAMYATRLHHAGFNLSVAIHSVSLECSLPAKPPPAGLR